MRRQAHEAGHSWRKSWGQYVVEAPPEAPDSARHDVLVAVGVIVFFLVLVFLCSWILPPVPR